MRSIRGRSSACWWPARRREGGTPVNTTSARYRICVWAVFLGGLGYLAYLNGGEYALHASMLTWPSLTLRFALAVVAALSTLPLPRGSGVASPTTALDVAAMLLFGPAGACWVALLSRLVMSFSEKR